MQPPRPRPTGPRRSAGAGSPGTDASAGLTGRCLSADHGDPARRGAAAAAGAALAQADLHRAHNSAPTPIASLIRRATPRRAGPCRHRAQASGSSPSLAHSPCWPRLPCGWFSGRDAASGLPTWTLHQHLAASRLDLTDRNRSRKQNPTTTPCAVSVVKVTPPSDSLNSLKGDATSPRTEDRAQETWSTRKSEDSLSLL